MQYGRYEIKKVQEVKAMSAETTCFALDLYVDGVKFAAVSNDGNGGSNRVHTYAPFKHSDLARVEAEMAEDAFLVDSEYEKFDSAITTLLSMRDAAKEIAKVTKTKVAFIVDGELRVLGYKDRKKAPDQNLFDHVAKQYPTASLLNTMEPQAAIIAYVKQARAETEAYFAAPPPATPAPRA